MRRVLRNERNAARGRTSIDGVEGQRTSDGRGEVKNRAGSETGEVGTGGGKSCGENRRGVGQTERDCSEGRRERGTEAQKKRGTGAGAEGNDWRNGGKKSGSRWKGGQGGRGWAWQRATGMWRESTQGRGRPRVHRCLMPPPPAVHSPGGRSRGFRPPRRTSGKASSSACASFFAPPSPSVYASRGSSPRGFPSPDSSSARLPMPFAALRLSSA